jgi:hypothetical protein
MIRSVNVNLDKEARRYLKSSKELAGIYSVADPTIEVQDDVDKNATMKVQDDVDEDATNETQQSADADATTNDNDAKMANESNDKSTTPLSAQPRTIIPIPEYATPYPENNAGHKSQPNTRRPRWKYAAQIIDTRALKNPPNSDHHGKKVAARYKAKRHGRVVDGNTLIEQDGHVRVATRAEVEQTSWKSVRNESEFMFKEVKDAWMRRQLEGEVGGWGPQEEVNKPKQVEVKEVESGEEGEESADGGDDVKEEEVEDEKKE